MNKSILITGGAGLLGSRLADWIIENKQEYEVVIVDNLSGGYVENINSKAHFYRLDCTDTLSIKEVFELHKPEYVYHLAAYAAEGLSPFIRCFNYENNLLATANIVNNCIKYDVKRLIFTSTMAVYGHGTPPFDESHLPSPIDPYGVAKYACEQDIRIAGEQHDLDWCIIRPHNVYGIKQNIWDKYRNVLGIWMYQVLNNKPMTIYGDGTQTRAFSYIDDCLEPLWKAAMNENASKQIINLGGTREYSIKEANELLREVIGYGETVHLEPRHEVKYAHPTWKKSVDLLGYEDKTSLGDGLYTMWEWAKSQPQREQFVWSEYELEKGIYSFWKNKGKE
jgi:UDP-glucose 4-epimerase